MLLHRFAYVSCVPQKDVGCRISESPVRSGAYGFIYTGGLIGHWVLELSHTFTSSDSVLELMALMCQVCGVLLCAVHEAYYWGVGQPLRPTFSTASTSFTCATYMLDFGVKW